MTGDDAFHSENLSTEGGSSYLAKIVVDVVENRVLGVVEVIHFEVNSHSQTLGGACWEWEVVHALATWNLAAGMVMVSIGRTLYLTKYYPLA